MVDTLTDTSTAPTAKPAETAAELIIVSGLSGSGKTVALRTLEDLGYYCVDNLPAALMPAFVQAISQGAATLHHKLAVGVDVRNRAENLNRLPAILAELAQAQIAYRIVFLDTRDDVLIKRYSETRRRHPLSAEGLGLAEAIATERRLLRPMVSIADRVVDTSDLNVHQLRRLIINEMGLAAGGLTLLFESFAYRRGVPTDADFVFDARCILPNPHYDPGLRPLTGHDREVASFLERETQAGILIEDIQRFLQRWIPKFLLDQRASITVAIGCTGGRHRSVYIAEELARRFATDHPVIVRHRDLKG